MAQSHLKTVHGKTLCGIFLSSAMALAGCGSAPPKAPAPPADPDISYDTTITHFTGEEELKKPVPFSRIEKNGDPRIRRIIARLRMSSVGEELYQFAAKNDVQFLWEENVASRKGAYHYYKRLIVVDKLHSDDGVLSTLAHEIRHAWQDSTLDVTSWILEPADHWRASQMIEADSCAFNAHFVANYKDETGYMLDLRNSFSESVSRSYTQKPAAERNYMQDGLASCLKITLRPYSRVHMENIRERFSRNSASFYEAATSHAYRIAYRSWFNTLDTSRKATLFKGFVNDTLDSNTILPDAYNMTAEDFLNWVKEHTPYNTPEDQEEVQKMDQDFRRMRQELINALS